MLNMYQLWLDDLYPRAKFADALTIIEKVGHTKRMQIMRKDWIEEGKPRRTTEPGDDDDVPVGDPNTELAQQHTEVPEDQAHDIHTGNTELAAESSSRTVTAPISGNDPDEDELDALLAESAETGTTTSTMLPSRTKLADHDPFADEMEAMADMEDMW